MPIGIGTGLAIAGGSAVAGAGISALAASSAAGKQANAATQAAQLQYDAANRAADMQLGMFNTIRGDLSPYRAAGGAALPGYMALLGIPSSAYAPSASGAPVFTTGATPATAAAPSAFDAGSLAGSSAGQPDWDAYLQANPDVMAEYQKVNGPGLGYFLGLGGSPHDGGLTPQQFAQWHYNTKGQSEGRQLSMIGAAPAAAAPAAADPTAAAMPNGQSMQDFLASTPGYQFTRDQGMQAVENTLTARGLGGLSGALGKGLSRFVTGLADQTYQSQLDNYRTAAGMGQSAASQTGTFGQAATSGAASSLVGGANAQAAGITGAAQAGAAGMVGGANAINSALSTIGTLPTTSRILGMYGNGGAGAPSFGSTPYAAEPWYAEGA